MAKRFLTLNIGAATVELAEYEAGVKGALTLVNYGKAALAAPLDDGNADTILSPALLEIVREKGIKPGKVALSISGQMVFPKFAAIPMAGGAEKFEQMIRYEIEQNIPFPIDEMVCDRQVLGDTENGDKSVMIVAAKVDQVESLTAAVRAAGFDPTLVDVSPIAVTNAVRAAKKDDDQCVVVLDIGAKTTSLVIVEGDKLYNRSIPVAGNTVTREVASALGVSQEEAEQFKLTRGYISEGGVVEDEDETTDRVAKACRAVMTRLNAEITRSINFYRSQQGGNAPVKMYLTGGSALLGQVDTFFTSTLQIPVEFFNPFETIAVGPKVDASAFETDAAYLAATAGLALHETGAARFTINLLPPSIVAEHAEKARIPFIAAGGALLIVALVLVMLGFNRQTTGLLAQRDAVQEKVDKLSAVDKKVSAAEKNLAEATAEADLVRKFMDNRTATIQAVNSVRASLLPGMWIEKWDTSRLTVRYWKGSVKGANGKTPSELVVDKLKAKPNVDAKSVKIADMTSVGKDGVVDQFTVELKFK